MKNLVYCLSMNLILTYLLFLLYNKVHNYNNIWRFDSFKFKKFFGNHEFTGKWENNLKSNIFKKEKGLIKFYLKVNKLSTVDKFLSLLSSYCKKGDIYKGNEYNHYNLDLLIYDKEIFEMKLGSFNFEKNINKKVNEMKNIYKVNHYTYHKSYKIDLNISINFNPLIIKKKKNKKYINLKNLYELDYIMKITIKSLTKNYNIDINSNLKIEENSLFIFMINLISLIIYIVINLCDYYKDYFEFFINYFFSIFFLIIINDLNLNKRNTVLFNYYLIILNLLIIIIIIIIQFKFFYHFVLLL